MRKQREVRRMRKEVEGREEGGRRKAEGGSILEDGVVKGGGSW